MTDEPEKPKHAGGRPTIFTEDVAEFICSEIATGSNLADICKARNMPGERTVYRWLAKN
jgi:hypothetical protein